MITHFELENFKGWEQLKLDLEPLTVIVGPNASGKTSILLGLLLLRASFSAALPAALAQHEMFFGVNRIGSDTFKLLGRTNSDIEFQFSADAPEDLNAAGRFRNVRRLFVVDSKTNSSRPQEFDALEAEERRLLLLQLGQTFKHLRFELENLKAPSYSLEIPPRLQSNGQGIASVLAYHKLRDTPGMQWIFEAITGIIPSIEGLSFDRKRTVLNEGSESESFTIADVILFRQNGAFLPASLMSEGTLFVLGILVALIETKGKGLLLIDDIDRGLHPKAQRDLIDLIRKLQLENPELQIVATSHSPYLLGALRPEEVRLTTIAEDGTLYCKPLTDHPEFDKWKEMMSPGEFWSMVGEDWVAPAPTAIPLS